MSSPKAEAAAAPAPEESVPKSPEKQSHSSPSKDAEPEVGEREVSNNRDSNEDRESGEASEDSRPASPKNAPGADDAPPLPNEPTPSGPPLPNEPVPQPADDGWDCQWDPNTNAWFFVNRFTGKSQWENPRVATNTSADVAPGTQAVVPLPPAEEKPAAGGYNPAIHGDYDPNAWYAQANNTDEAGSSTAAPLADPSSLYAATATFNRFTGQFQMEGEGPERHNDEAKSRRQMNAYFDVDAAANSHDGRSLKAERSGKKLSKQELKAFKEKRRARKEEKRRAWLRD